MNLRRLSNEVKFWKLKNKSTTKSYHSEEKSTVNQLKRSSENMEYHASEELQYLNVLKTAVIAFVSGAAPQVAVEFGRRVIPVNAKPSFEEIEQAIRRIKK